MLSDKEFEERTAALFAQEATEPLRWYYLSFAGEEGFRGACIVEARGMLGAVSRCNVLGINPGGEVMGMPVPDGQLASLTEDAKNVLLSREKLTEIFGDMTTV
jgi:hypothetical protein